VDKSGQLDALIDGAEELLTNLTDAHNPAIQDLRDRVDHAINDTRRVIAENRGEMTVKLRDIAFAIDDYVRGYPWIALATGVLLAGGVAFIAGTAIASKKD